VSNPASVLGLLSGKDIEIIEFHPVSDGARILNVCVALMHSFPSFQPPLVFAFEKGFTVVLYTPPTVR
jgi:hypothetical protein